MAGCFSLPRLGERASISAPFYHPHCHGADSPQTKAALTICLTAYDWDRGCPQPVPDRDSVRLYVCSAAEKSYLCSSGKNRCRYSTCEKDTKYFSNYLTNIWSLKSRLFGFL